MNPIRFIGKAAVVVVVVAGTFMLYLSLYNPTAKHAVTVVDKMDKCLKEEVPKGVGSSHLDYTHRICWMRAKKG